VNLDLAPGLSVELDRGPGWLFVRLHVPSTAEATELDLCEQLSTLLENEFANRLVVELDDVELLRSALLGQLVELHKRICGRDGVMRICGLSERNYQVLRRSRLQKRFPRFDTRHDAVMGHHPLKPR
jgi:anti-anti-sigma factor